MDFLVSLQELPGPRANGSSLSGRVSDWTSPELLDHPRSSRHVPKQGKRSHGARRPVRLTPGGCHVSLELATTGPGQRGIAPGALPAHHPALAALPRSGGPQRKGHLSDASLQESSPAALLPEASAWLPACANPTAAHRPSGCGSPHLGSPTQGPGPRGLSHAPRRPQGIRGPSAAGHSCLAPFKPCPLSLPG